MGRFVNAESIARTGLHVPYNGRAMHRGDAIDRSTSGIATATHTRHDEGWRDMVRGSVTIRDVARHAGVSISTASRALGGGSASAKTRTKVQQAAAALHFLPNTAAQQLITGRSNVVAIMITETPDFMFQDAFISSITSQLMNSFTKANLFPFLVLIAPNDAEGFARLLHNSRADGMVVVSFHYSEQFATVIEQFGRPTVFVGKPPLDMDYPYVDPDQLQGGRMAGQVLTARGRRHIAIIEGPTDMHSPHERNDRTTGCVRALHDAGLSPIATIPGPYTMRHGIEAAHEVLTEHPEVDGFFAHSDQIAAGVLHLLHQHDRHVPRDISVVGFDNFQAAGLVSPPLTTIAQPLNQLAEAATEMLCARLEQGQWPYRRKIFPVHLVERDSV